MNRSPQFLPVAGLKPGRVSCFQAWIVQNWTCQSASLIQEDSMPDPVDALVIDLLEWIGERPRPYAEVMEAWRTSCPRLPVWEEANARGFLGREHRPGAGSLVSVSPAGNAHLGAHFRGRQGAA
jgi:hypothetical protein